jgi:hypothetical protein
MLSVTSATRVLVATTPVDTGHYGPARARRDVFPTQTRQHDYTDIVCNDWASVLKWRREPYSQHKDI